MDLTEMMRSESEELRLLASLLLSESLQKFPERSMKRIIDALRSENVLEMQTAIHALSAARDDGIDIFEAVQVLHEIYESFDSENFSSDRFNVVYDALMRFDEAFRKEQTKPMEDPPKPEPVKLSEDEIIEALAKMESDSENYKGLAASSVLTRALLDDASNNQIVAGCLDILEKRGNEKLIANLAILTLKGIADKGNISPALPKLVEFLGVSIEKDWVSVRANIAEAFGNALGSEKTGKAAFSILLDLLGNENFVIRNTIAMSGLATAAEEGFLTENNIVEIRRRMAEILKSDKDETLKIRSRDLFSETFRIIISNLKPSKSVGELKTKKPERENKGGKFRIRRT